ncbi:MAG: DEAD/DEAH box helicase [Bacteroidota bacterium]
MPPTDHRAALNPALATAFYQELLKVLHREEQEVKTRVLGIEQLLHLVFQEATRRDKLPFTTHFARLAYAAHQYGLPRQLQYYVHQFRRRARDETQQTETTTLHLGAKVTAEVLLGIWQVNIPEDLIEWLPLEWPLQMQTVAVASFRPRVRVLALADEPATERLLVRDEAVPEREVYVQYNVPDRNEEFAKSIQILRQVTGFPVTLNLLDVEVGADGIYRPRAFVIEPDFLVDVSAVANAFQGATTHPWGHLLKKFLPFEQSIPLLLGNIANFFLDELMTNPSARYEDLAPRIFQLSPLALCCFSERELREMMQKAQGHYVRLQQMVQTGFTQEGMEHEHCYLEPTFYSERHGLQGRLDLLYRSPDPQGQNSIVELKSGKPFMPNRYGIGPSHYIQTVLYDFLVHATYGDKINVGCYILYSSQQERPLRFAPAIKARQFEALEVRNHLVAIEYLLCQLGLRAGDLYQQTQRVIGRLDPGRFPLLKGFASRNLQTFASVWQRLKPLEIAYIGAFAGFVAREQQLAKIGVQGVDKLNGLASLWLDHWQDKEEQYQRLAKLQLVVNQTKEEEPLLILRRTEQTNPLANFRKGDIAVLFPYTSTGHGALRHQVFKCTIVAIDAEQVTVRLRCRQFNDRLFREQEFWTLEHDLLDSSFLAYYRGLFEWAQQHPDRRQLLLGQRAPRPADPAALPWPTTLTKEQATLLNQLLAAPEYFLLWGPPGTGKTSVMLHYAVKHLLEETEENILLLAYTNRAVDEICESIERISEEVRGQYLRIGSNYGTHPNYQSQLLQNQSSSIRKRQDLRQLIDQRRIFVGTVASLASKPELFQLKTFERVIIDEASQILEPLIIGLLSRFPKWVLVGDHRQLPAVVTQDKALTQVRDNSLVQAGITDLSQSLFERLFLNAQANGWTWAYGQLTHQGRMHRDVMAFPAQFFYQQQLQCLPQTLSAYQRQCQPLGWTIPADANVLEQQLAKQRLLFFATTIDEDSTTQKTNRHEAQLIVDMIRALERLSQGNNETLTSNRIGIITPYRAQIAQIRSLLAAADLDPDRFTIDTVERYQGGARDIILISLCTNHPRQLQSLVSLSSDGVDRKLNVAMTRAREQLVLVGNPAILRQSEGYRALLDFIKK